MNIFGLFPINGEGYSSDTVNDAVPTAQSQDYLVVVFKIPGPIGTSRDHFHFVWKVSAIPLDFENRHMLTMGSSQDSRLRPHPGDAGVARHDGDRWH